MQTKRKAPKVCFSGVHQKPAQIRQMRPIKLSLAEMLLTCHSRGMTSSSDTGPRGYHDIGGDLAGDIPKVELPWLHWEKQTEAIRALLGDGTRRIVSLDEMRRGFESFGEEKYDSLSFYRRRLEAMTDILIEKGVINREELEAAVRRGRSNWQPETE